ncbi:porin family protein [Allomuricauda sp. SCSIO 65647]|uniref:porin family protein n=1 Tax=Allomuricauda sp. SCSIO 65647 TaxID=2908843 RepID=UPI001F3DA509|nr:porin family protein [Muricauda sp. SCSIO 65647]UJH68440.1 PorT family protein [Muricauda sp. SCSIO 65647]
MATCFLTHAQVYPESEYAGTKYLEDQFYVGVGYNFLLQKPEDVVQRSLSYNLIAGFIKDIPINQRRNVGFGLGLGYAVNSYYTNLRASQNGDEITYTIIDLDDFRRSKFETHAIEIPVEFRWRTSTDVEYKFWRIYSGINFAYVFARSSRLVTDESSDRFKNDDIRNFQYGAYVRFGYNTWNINFYYDLSTLLNDGVVLDNGSPIEMRSFRIGLIFYIL